MPDGLYLVTCVGVEERVVEGDQFGNNEKVELHISFDVDGEEAQLDPRCNAKWSEKATLFKWALAFGLRANPNEPFDTDSFKGKKAQAVIHTETEGSWPRIQSFMPYKQSAPARSTTATQRSESIATGAALVNSMGDIEWKVFWSEVERLGGTKEGIKAKVGGDLLKMEELSVTEVQDLLEALKI